MKIKNNLFAFCFFVAACNTAPKTNPETPVKKELKPEQKVTTVENLHSSQKEPNPESELEILVLGKFLLPDVSTDSTNEYGAGDCFGKVTYYSQRNIGLGIDSMSCGEYGYTNTHYLLNSKKMVQAVYLKKSESLPQSDGTWKNALTERLIDFRNNRAIVKERMDTVNDDTQSIINKKFEIKELKDRQTSLEHWNNEFQVLWEKEN
ncbi:MAG: hypothetical protein LPK01_15310 [Hymenobacteraceae bacterium]|nr:hypothetical protein [Hymenobacteraceae bacterium]